MLVDFHSLHASTSSRDNDTTDLRGLFRDAEMNDAVIFFDECEAIFAKVLSFSFNAVSLLPSLSYILLIKSCSSLFVFVCTIPLDRKQLILLGKLEKW